MRVAMLVVAIAGGCATNERPPQTSAPPPAETVPTPYTSEAIRAANPPGTRLVFRIEQPGQTDTMHVIEFVEADADGALTVTRDLNAAGAPIGDAKRSRATWSELRDHAAFPAAVTDRHRDTVDVPVGHFEAWLYSVSVPEETTRFWFALGRAGPPVLMETERGGRITARMTLVEDSRGP